MWALAGSVRKAESSSACRRPHRVSSRHRKTRARSRVASVRSVRRLWGICLLWCPCRACIASRSAQTPPCGASSSSLARSARSQPCNPAGDYSELEPSSQEEWTQSHLIRLLVELALLLVEAPVPFLALDAAVKHPPADSAVVSGLVDRPAAKEPQANHSLAPGTSLLCRLAAQRAQPSLRALCRSHRLALVHRAQGPSCSSLPKPRGK